MLQATAKFKEQTEANFAKIIEYCKKRDIENLQELDSVEYAVVRKKIADLQVTTSVQNLIGYQLPEFISVTSVQSEKDSKFLSNSAQYEAEFNFMSKFDPNE